MPRLYLTLTKLDQSQDCCMLAFVVNLSSVHFFSGLHDPKGDLRWSGVPPLSQNEPKLCLAGYHYTLLMSTIKTTLQDPCIFLSLWPKLQYVLISLRNKKICVTK